MTDIKTEALSLILSLLIIIAVIFTATRCSKSTLGPQEKHKYNTETYKDDEVIYKIITDRAGDVIYCEPME